MVCRLLWLDIWHCQELTRSQWMLRCWRMIWTSSCRAWAVTIRGQTTSVCLLVFAGNVCRKDYILHVMLTYFKILLQGMAYASEKEWDLLAYLYSWGTRNVLYRSESRGVFQGVCVWGVGWLAFPPPPPTPHFLSNDKQCVHAHVWKISWQMCHCWRCSYRFLNSCSMEENHKIYNAF